MIHSSTFFGLFYIRLFNFGIIIIDHRKMKKLFSERLGYKTYPHIGPYCIRIGKWSNL